MVLLSIDRILEDIAVCEDENGNERRFNLRDLPSDARETDMIRVTDGGKIFIDKEETSKRKKEILELKESLETYNDI